MASTNTLDDPGERRQNGRRDADIQAEQRLRELLHDLEVHQEELTVQNEELRATRNQFETALARYTVLFENSPVGYICADRRRIMTEVNLKAATLIGGDRRHIQGKPLLVFMHRDSRPVLDAHYRAAEAGHAASAEMVLARSDGSELPVLIETSLLEGGQFLSAMLDITARKAAEARLRVALGELEQSNAELEQFAYSASHDLQEPLRMVSSYLQLLERRYRSRLDKDADDFIAFAVDGARRMQRMIVDLLEFSRVGRQGGRPVPVDSGRAVAEALENLKVMLGDAGGEVVVDPSLPTVMADQSQFVRVFQNLISNALRFRAPGCIPVVTISARREEIWWHFQVKDNGIGIDERNFGRLFKIFQRLHAPGEYEGSGIGLAVTKKIIERHGGRIWVESVPGQGSIFHFTVPCVQDKPDAE